MIRDKRRLQFYSSLAISLLVLGLGLLWGAYGVDRFRSALEQKMAEDSEIIGENLRIFIRQVTREYTDQQQALAQIQEVLEVLKKKKWYGFACVLDKDGRVLAHPRSEFIDMQIPLETYEPTALLGDPPPRADRLPALPGSEGSKVYRTQADIIAIQWLPEMMTYLCVHQSVGPLNERVEALTRFLFLIGLGFIGLSASGSWFFVGRLVDRYESHLGRSEARNRVLVQNSAPILVVDASGAILDANPEAERLFGTPESSLAEHTLADLWPPEGRPRPEDIYRQVEARDVVECPDIDLLTLGGRVIPADLRACRVDYGDREAIYLLIRDVTESRRAREEILEANRRLRELDQLKTDFLNMVSHELRTPLTSIRWSAESLAAMARGKEDENVRKLLGIIRDDNQRLSVLVEQLLGFARMDAGKLKPHLETVRLTPLLRNALGEVAPIAQKKRIAVEADGLPASLSLKADPEQLRQVFINILDNAIKYTPPGGRVRLSARSGAGRVEVQVRDTGIGIPEKDLPHIFEKFYRADHPEARQEKGTGLGLAIVKGIVDAHGGDIRAHSSQGSGTTFTVSLPESPAQPDTA